MAVLPQTEAGKNDRPVGPLNVSPLTEDPGADVVAGAEEEYIDGFSWKTVIGALFIGFIMMPGAIYLGLIAGQGMGPAAEWVTIILFMEIARRSYQTLKKQELYLLYYIGASLTLPVVGGLAISGGPFAALIWNSYMVHTPYAQALGIPQGVPPWVSPPADSAALIGRSFFNTAWLAPIGLLMFNQVFNRMSTWGLGYVLFRITSDVERLPFPLAPIAAEGATALAESSSQKEGWRWRIFSIGAMIGVGWGTLYVLLPSVTGLIFAQPITLVSVPFIDYTKNTEKILPGALTGLGTDLGQVFTGFVLPLPVVVGSFISSVGCHIFGNSFFLYPRGILKDWTPGTDMLQSQVVNYFNFWLSFSIGTSAVVAVLGIVAVFRALIGANRRKNEGVAAPQLSAPKGRGDIPIPIALLGFVIGTTATIIMCHILVPGFHVSYLIFFGFIWTPLFSYINARMAGMAGSSVSVPYVREASFMMARYEKVDIWFAPIPLNDYGFMAQNFRTVELTRTKFTSIAKVELMMLPILLGCSLLFWSFIWKLSPIPAATYPFAAKFWPVTAQTQSLWMTANRAGESNVLLKAINPNYIGVGAGAAALAYGTTIAAGLPALFFYGMVAGTHSLPAYTIPQFIGAMLGRYYFQKRYGKENWRSYTPVLVAGYYCGMGLIGMAAVALALLSKSVSRLPY